jgi:octanoyl-[GcvH]:protein N-octanoyltransferase
MKTACCENWPEDHWRVARLAEARAAEYGLEHQQAFADDLTGESSARVLLVWRSQPALLVTRQDTGLPRFMQACDRLKASGWPILVRKSGGAACPIAPGTVQVAMIEPAVAGASIDAKYDALTRLIQCSLRYFAIASDPGSVALAYCPGNHDLTVAGKKIAGMSQHWFRNCHGVQCAVTAASINVEEAPILLADAVNQFYRSAGNPTRCQASALTSLRLCDADRFAAVRDLAAVVMDKLASDAGSAAQ